MTPRGLLFRASLIAIVYGVLHVAGARAHVSFLSGTPAGSTLALVLGCAYLVMHFLFVIVAPILGLAACTLALWPSKPRAS